MNIQMQVLNIGFGTMEGTPWAKAEILDGTIEHIDDGQRVFKGAKTAKLNIDPRNNFEIAKRFSRETFPSNFEVNAEMSVVGGKTQLKIVDFKTNLHQGK